VPSPKSKVEVATSQGRGDRPDQSVDWAWLGRAPYADVLSLQERLRDGIVQGAERETLLLVEHPSVITLGRNADAGNVLAAPEFLNTRGIPVVRVSRGGDVTFHGPGQLVGYPLFRLRDGVRAHVTAIGEAIIDVLAELGLSAEWRASHPGVWVGEEKVCAVGVHVRRGVAMHGFALNVNIDLRGFETIVPCGLRAFGVTSIAKQLGNSPSIDEMAIRTVRAFERRFAIRMEEVSFDSRLQIANQNL
jgi:lipoyl(octanoyl) transferase